MPAEIVVVIAKIVLGLASGSVGTEAGRRDDVVVDADPDVVALNGRDRDTVRRRGPGGRLGDFEAQRYGCDLGCDMPLSNSSASATVPGPLRVLNTCAIARGP
jgi:hypothetical protein